MVLRVTSDDHSTISAAASRVLLSPARRAARSSRKQLESALEEVLGAPEVAHLIDAALAGPLAEQLTRSLVEHRVLQRMVDELMRSGELDKLVTEVVESTRTAELVDRALSSPATEQALRRVLAGPEVRDALTRQTVTFGDELLGAIRRRMRNLDDRLGRTPSPDAEANYSGVASRALALATDVVLVNVGVFFVAGLLAIIGSFFGGIRPEWLAAALLSLGEVLAAAGYFILCWSSLGQTPGMRLMHVRVSSTAGTRISEGRSVVRFLGLVLAVVPMFAGFIPALFDSRRRALPDYLAGTVVTYYD
jgi:uncharacterized RDD family membrane protein YckC